MYKVKNLKLEYNRELQSLLSHLSFTKTLIFLPVLCKYGAVQKTYKGKCFNKKGQRASHLQNAKLFST